MKKTHKHINHDLSLVVQLLRSNKISLNADKTKIEKKTALDIKLI